jgi:hypothetical protein
MRRLRNRDRHNSEPNLAMTVFHALHWNWEFAAKALLCLLCLLAML